MNNLIEVKSSLSNLMNVLSKLTKDEYALFVKLAQSNDIKLSSLNSLFMDLVNETNRDVDTY
ncbi:hypothetical protein [Paenibacillus dendritiformis]|uniref:hypothetical protein n=1 Tax=Paenibacillus dendritiformis TaxID=130049 RepID=UPI00387E1CC3